MNTLSSGLTIAKIDRGFADSIHCTSGRSVALLQISSGSVVKGDPNLEEETNGKALDGTLDRRVLSHAGAPHRVGNVAIDTGLPGDRDGRRRRRRRGVNHRATRPARQRWLRFTVFEREGGSCPPFLFLVLVAVLLYTATRSRQCLPFEDSAAGPTIDARSYSNLSSTRAAA